MSDDGFPMGRVAIVGAGQVGTMLGIALRETPAWAGVEEVGLLDRDPSVAAASLRRGAGDRILARPREAAGFDAVILALPVPEVLRFLSERGADVRPGALVMDTGGAKRVVVEAMRGLPASVHALGGHPVAGTERSGPEAAAPELLRGAPFVLSPVRPDPEAMARGRALARAVGARPVEMDAGAHDQVVARTSHLPHVMASALALSVAASGSPDEVGDLVSGGYEGATRLARSDPEMVAGFLAANADEVRRAVRELEKTLDLLAEALAADRGRLVALLSTARARCLRGRG